MARQTGLPEGENLFRPTAPPERLAGGESDEAAADAEGRGGAAEETRPAGKPRGKKLKPRKKLKRGPDDAVPRNLHLSDGVYDRLRLYARDKGFTVSCAAEDVLNKNLPRYEIKRAS